MANLTETASFDASIYQIATSDPVKGGIGTDISNKQAQSLANRTAYLKQHIDAAEGAIAALQAALAASPTTPAAGDDAAHFATTQFVHRNSGGGVVVNIGGNSPVTLNSDQWGVAIVILTGVLTGDVSVIFPTRYDRWTVVNRTSGAFGVTCKTAAGTGVVVAQGRSKDVFCDNTNICDEYTDLAIRWVKKTGAYTAANGDRLLPDQSGGTFPITLPASPTAGDEVWIKGSFAATNLTVSRNGQMINGAASDLILDRDNVTASLVYDGATWRV